MTGNEAHTIDVPMEKIEKMSELKMLGPSDIEKATVALTRNQLTPEEVQIVVEKVLEEADMDDDGKLSFTEFEHVITRAPDFIR
ncbi:DNA-dependent protein kinase catalytic subunit-interacting protein, putative [Ixodes scapularis]|uniref:DNA-dependent protein kinase catalytic subunit-interacting protein, putative n=1 Tax=Ixodes scapularis TaxID=6945 RepID=B7P4T7_IXOSC|nr:DNA-dependent protein kinase catalytic subunit-interacting protein, putative [Ixodes scapularis]|eukprot:XP_002406438.1 DNA-dependent protein kinase catalytic subunit-interacting protein, putative [Ixodes scapularis]